jgi:hypothetical protein
MWDLDIEGGHRISTAPEEPTDPLRYGSVAGAYVEFLTGGFMQMLSYPFDAERLDTAERERTLNVNGIAVQELPVELSGALDDAESGEFDGTQVRDIVDARVGAATPRHETDDGFATLLWAGETTGSIACVHAPETDISALVSEESSVGVPLLPTDGLESASGAVFHIDLDNGDPPQPASATIRYPEASSVDTESLPPLGSAAQNRDLTQDGRTVLVTGEYSWAALSEFDTASDS